MSVLIIKWLHVFAAMAWAVGLLYVPRQLVYLAEREDAASRELLRVMARRLWRISLIGMALALFLGLMLLGYGVSGGWIVAKLALVALLIGYFFSLPALVKKLAEGRATRGARFFRLYNEVAALLLLAILGLAIVKPF